MNYNETERRGRRLMLLLLGLNLFLRAMPVVNVLRSSLRDIYPAGTLPLVYAGLAVGLLPTAVELWALYRGSWPALALLCISVFIGAGDVVGLFQFGGAAAMRSYAMLSLMVLLGRGILLAAIFRQEEVNCWWNLQRLRRKRWHLVLEIVLYVLASAASGWFGHLV